VTDGRIAELSLADWRRRMAALYTSVRQLLPTDPDAALALWRSERETLYREHPESPVPADQRASFRALHFPADPALRFEVNVELDVPSPDEPAGHEPARPVGFGAPLFSLPVSSGGAMSFRRIGLATVPFQAGERRLALFWMDGYAGGLFMPFRDATNGHETYGAGRYLLDAAKSADLGGSATRDSLILDFNFAYQPSCAFDPRWVCPLAPPENWLDLPVRAGERIA